MLPSICPSEGRRMRCWHGNLHISEAAPVDNMVRGWRHPRMVGRCVDLGWGWRSSVWVAVLCMLYVSSGAAARQSAGWLAGLCGVRGHCPAKLCGQLQRCAVLHRATASTHQHRYNNPAPARLCNQQPRQPEVTHPAEVTAWRQGELVTYLFSHSYFASHPVLQYSTIHSTVHM